MIRAKTALNEVKHTEKKSQKNLKIIGSRNIRSTIAKVESSVDSQANKENNMPYPIIKTRNAMVKKLNEDTDKKDSPQVISKNLETQLKAKKKLIKKSPEKVVEAEISENESECKPVVKRVSLKKRVDPVLNESASKVSINESNKENSELIKTPTSSDMPKDSYELRRRGRGRQPKKSSIYKNEENLIYSHEKEEEMHKHDDSEFKLPNKDKSKLV